MNTTDELLRQRAELLEQLKTVNQALVISLQEESGTTPNKRGGRPKGSTNKPKVNLKRSRALKLAWKKRKAKTQEKAA
jgi:hypothetical protein